jgi:hypothetical protein
MLNGRVARDVSRSRHRYRPDVLCDGSRILLIDLERSDLHIDEVVWILRMTHQLHEGRQADAGAHHIRGEGVTKTVRVGDFDAGGPAMMAKQRAQSRGSHAGAASRALERNEQSVCRVGGPFQPQIVIEQLSCFRSQRQEAGLITLAAHADLRFRQQQIVRFRSRTSWDRSPATASIRRWPDPVRCESWTRTAPPHPPTAARNGSFGVLTRNRSGQAVACRCPSAHAASRSFEIPEQSDEEHRGTDAQGAIDNGNALVDGGAGQRRLLTGLESHIVEQCRFGEGIFGDRVGVMNTLPPTEKVQQLVRITLQGTFGQAAKVS